MVMASRARNSQELSPKLRPSYALHKPVRNPRAIPSEGARLIYFDQNRAAGLLEHIASSENGCRALSKLSNNGLVDFTLQRNQRAILSQIIAQADDLKGAGIIDLHQPGNSSRRMCWADVHPDQAIAVRGMIVSVKDVQQSSLRLCVDSIPIRVFVGQDHFLHLNQSYLTAWEITAVGKVRSVPRSELYAVVIAVMGRDITGT